jgi:hypothetical protein
MNPDSLRAYACHGHSLHINWVDQAERAIIDTKQTTNTPKVCNSEGNAALSGTAGMTGMTGMTGMAGMAGMAGMTGMTGMDREPRDERDDRDDRDG